MDSAPASFVAMDTTLSNLRKGIPASFVLQWKGTSVQEGHDTQLSKADMTGLSIVPRHLPVSACTDKSPMWVQLYIEALVWAVCYVIPWCNANVLSKASYEIASLSGFIDAELLCDTLPCMGGMKIPLKLNDNAKAFFYDERTIFDVKTNVREGFYDCGESLHTLRYLAAVAHAVDPTTRFTCMYSLVWDILPISCVHIPVQNLTQVQKGGYILKFDKKNEDNNSGELPRANALRIVGKSAGKDIMNILGIPEKCLYQ